jgi:hypothetical protein
MIASGIARPLCIVLAAILGAPFGSAQTSPEAPKTAAPQSAPPVLKIVVLEGGNATNSIPLGRSVTPVIEVRDENEFPVEGATVVFTLPQSGPGGSFPGNRSAFTTRSSAQGQAAAPFLVNNVAGRFRIQVTATAANGKGETWIDQTNTTGGYIGPAISKRAWYKKWYIWAILGAAAAAGGAVALTRGNGGSSAPTITIIPGGPVFSGPH